MPAEGDVRSTGSPLLTRAPQLLTALAVISVLGACAAREAPGARTSQHRPCSKVDAELAGILEHMGEQERVGVVVELSTAPRARDVLWAGVAGCVPGPSMAGGGSWAGDVPWGEREIGQPSSFPAMCVGWTTRREIVGWCGDPTVRSVEAWR
jgi:hypothetical protein